MRLFALLAIALLCCTACTLPISQPSLDLVEREITFAALRQEPDDHAEEHVPGAAARERGAAGRRHHA